MDAVNVLSEPPSLSRPPILTPLPTASTPLSPNAKPSHPRPNSVGREPTTPLSPSWTSMCLDDAAADVTKGTPSKRVPIVAPPPVPITASTPLSPDAKPFYPKSTTPLSPSSTPLSPKAKPFYPRSHSVGHEPTTASTPMSPKAKPFYPQSLSFGSEPNMPLTPSKLFVCPEQQPSAAADLTKRTPSKRLPIEAPPAAVLSTPSTPLSPKAKPFYPRSHSLGREPSTPSTPLSPKAKPFYPRSLSLGCVPSTPSTPLSPKAKPFYPRSHSLGREPTTPSTPSLLIVCPEEQPGAVADVTKRTPSKRLPIVAPIEAPPLAVPSAPCTPVSPKAKPFMPPTPSSRGRSLVRAQPPQTPTLLSPNAKPFWPRHMVEESPARPHNQAPDVSSLMSPQIPLARYRIPESPVTPFPGVDLSKLPNPTCAPTMAQAKAITELSKLESLWKMRTTPGKTPMPTSPGKEAVPALTDSETWSSVDWWSPGLKLKKDCATQSSPKAIEEPKKLFADLADTTVVEMTAEGLQDLEVGNKTMTEAEFNKLLVDSDTIRSPQVATKTATCDMGTDPSPEPLMVVSSKASRKVKDHLKHTRSTLKKRRTALSVFHGDWAEKMVATQVQHEMEHEVHQPKDDWSMIRPQVSIDDTMICMEPNEAPETVMCLDTGVTTVKAPKPSSCSEPETFMCMDAQTTVVKDLKCQITVKDPQCQTRPEPASLPALRSAPVDDDEETEGQVSPAFSDLSMKTALSHHTEKPTEKRASVRINPCVSYDDPASPTVSEPTTPRAGPTMLDIFTSPVAKLLGGARRAMHWLSTPAAPETRVHIDTKVRRKPCRTTARRAGSQGNCPPVRRSSGRICIRTRNVVIELTEA